MSSSIENRYFFAYFPFAEINCLNYNNQLFRAHNKDRENPSSDKIKKEIIHEIFEDARRFFEEDQDLIRMQGWGKKKHTLIKLEEVETVAIISFQLLALLLRLGLNCCYF